MKTDTIFFELVANRYLITYALTILSTLMHKQAQTQESTASRSCYQTFLLPEVSAFVKTKDHSPALTKRKSPLTLKSTNASYLFSIILIFNCGKSLRKPLLFSNSRISSNRETINSIISSIFIQCISGHSHIPRNESTNRAAKEATL